MLIRLHVLHHAAEEPNGQLRRAGPSLTAPASSVAGSIKAGDAVVRRASDEIRDGAPIAAK
jgi:hypothetical protein